MLDHVDRALDGERVFDLGQLSPGTLQELNRLVRFGVLVKRLPFLEYLEKTLGTRKWAVAPRLTQRMRSNGYEVAVSQARYRRLKSAFEQSKPAHSAIYELSLPNNLRKGLLTIC